MLSFYKNASDAIFDSYIVKNSPLEVVWYKKGVAMLVSGGSKR